MAETNQASRHADELRRLGFPESVISETVRAEERGLFRFEPSPELVQETIASCLKLLRAAPRQQNGPTQKLTPAGMRSAEVAPAIAGFAKGVFAYQDAKDLFAAKLNVLGEAVGEDTGGLSLFDRLPVNCLAAINFAHTKGRRPLMIVDNHNVVDPAWWNFDSGFLAVRRALRIVNAIARESNAPPVAVMTVLRPDIGAYSHSDLTAISHVLCTASSDIWMVPYDLAGEYKNQDLFVFGEDRVLKLDGKVSSPGEAFGAFYELNGQSVGNAVRGGIEQITGRAVQVRSNGAFVGMAQGAGSAEGARALIAGVIQQGHASAIQQGNAIAT